MAPNIALLYSGSEVNGPVGRGWTIQGISSITRCPASKATDGAARAVKYGVDDKLCLDGQRLIQTDANGAVVNGDAVADPDHPFQSGDSAGGDGMVREYRTEKDIYARIRAYGKAGGDGANGPLYFRVWTKAGQLYEYGGAGDARANAAITVNNKVVAWAVSRIFDAVGNHMDFQYEQRDVAWGTALNPNSTDPNSGHEWNLLEIRYTGHGTGQPPTNKMVFTYSDRADTPGQAQDRGEAYHMGQKNVSVRRLDAISTYINWPATSDTQPASAIRVKVVKLAYENGAVTRRSRLKSITECAGANTDICLPPVSFSYAEGGGLQYSANANFAAGGLAGLPLQSTNGDTGILVGNFFGTGRTDILRWSDNPALNQLYRNDGNGNFTQIAAGSGAGSFTITDQNLFKSNGCYVSTALDFNGDGATDILRTMKSSSNGNSCGTVQNILYLSNGDGSFTAKPLDGIDFSQRTSTRRTITRCAGQIPNAVPAQTQGGHAPESAARAKEGLQGCPNGYVYLYSQTEGAVFHLLDVNNDGLLDIVTTILPGYTEESRPPTAENLCIDMTCTRVYLAQVDGSFVEKTGTNVAQRSLYANPNASGRSVQSRPFIGDINGDGMADLAVDTGVWYSRGDGNFDFGGKPYGAGCDRLLDVNGDGRSDCLSTTVGEWPGSQQALIADGTGNLLAARNFNLNTAGYELGSYLPNTTIQNMGFITADFDGDGRGDILRWSDNPAQNLVYLSNGDGTFRQGDFNLNQPEHQLQKSDGSYDFVVGDFMGNGQTEILRMVSGPDGTKRNVLYQKNDVTPPDQLISAVSPSGLKTTLKWGSLAAAGTLYTSDFGDKNLKSKYPVRDLNVPMQVVTSLTTDTGVGAGTLTTTYLYAGLRMAYDGRGWLGFREMRTQSPTVNDKFLTVLTEFEQEGVNTGAALLTRTWLGDIGGAEGSRVVSNTYNIYCDKTAPPDAEAGANSGHPCYSTAKVRRPYLYMTQEEGWDLDGTALPTVSTINTFNDSGDVTKIVNSTLGVALGQTQLFIKTTDNTYFPNNTADDKWILGRLKTAKVTAENHVKDLAQGLRRQGAAARFAKVDQIDVLTAATVKQRTSTAGTVSDSIARIPTSAGSAPYATATKGVAYTVKVTPNPFKVIGTVAGKVSGTLTATVAGGIAPYQYRWSLISGSQTALSSTTIASPVVSATLALGDNITETWLLTVTDAANSVISASVPVTLAVPAAALTVKIDPNPLKIDVNDPGDGFATLNATPAGGVAPYTYSWTRSTGSRSAVSNSAIASPVVKAALVAGDAFTEQWKVTVTDAAAKTAAASVNVTFSAPAVLTVPLTATRSVTANASTGIATSTLSVVPTGGRTPYTYNWERIAGTRSTVSNPALSGPVVSLSMTPGETVTETWQVTVTDSAGHSKAASTAITFNNPPTAMGLVFAPAIFKVNANDPGLAGGDMTATASGGVPPYSYAWTRSTGTRTSVSNAAIANPRFSATLAAAETVTDVWKLTITDSTGKSYAESVNIGFNAPAALAVPLTAARTLTASAATNGVASATLSVAPTGGRAPYTYNWVRSSGSRSSTPDATDPTPLVSAPVALGESYVENWTVTVTDTVGHSSSASTALTFTYPPSALTVAFSPVSPMRLSGDDPGTFSAVVTATAKGGIPPYTYSWAHTGAGRTTISNSASAAPTIGVTLAAGENGTDYWDLTVKDSAAKSATGRLSLSFGVPAVLKLTLPATVAALDATAANKGVSSATFNGLTVSGGSGGNTYLWTRLSGTRSAALTPTSSTGPGIRATLELGERLAEDWQLTVTDDAGHTASARTTVTFEYPGEAIVARFVPISLTVNANDPGVVTGQLGEMTVTGGVPPYRYSWAHVGGTGHGTLTGSDTTRPAFTTTAVQGESVSDLYRVTITDSFGTVAQSSYTTYVVTPDLLSAGLATTRTLTASAGTKGVASGGMLLTAAGGRAPYTYAWSRVSGSRGVISDTTIANAGLSAVLALGETFQETWQVVVRDSVGHELTKTIVVTFSYPGTALGLTLGVDGAGVQPDPGTYSATIHPTVTGGVPPFSYAWRRLSGTQTIANDSAEDAVVTGTIAAYGGSSSSGWSVTVTDAVGKTIATSVTATFSTPAKLAVTVPARSVNIAGTGTGAGSIAQATTITGGKAPYTLSWTRLAGSRATISNTAISNPTFSATLTPGETVVETWQLQVTDSFGHTETGSNTLTFKRAAAGRALTAQEAADNAAGDAGGVK
ncbi:FG-GAP-like repeat-containing protein [Rugamonas sp. A1-17]|nr:FG-GAP-like repeat-containing protein [Rugamonas sp. A1-17]